MAPTGDVLEVILKDHQPMDDPLRLVCGAEAERRAALRDFAHLLTDHGEAGRALVHAVTQLTSVPPHHTDDEERIFVNHAWENVSRHRREELGAPLARTEARRAGGAPQQRRRHAPPHGAHRRPA
ncbi:hypothetical protein [Streptomyces sp. AM6-12]|uniref:hypothetical protein n=1 Tax=Streptomyces sp. AM6-12 TaxID=3345149 RepID=UPI0037973526